MHRPTAIVYKTCSNSNGDWTEVVGYAEGRRSHLYVHRTANQPRPSGETVKCCEGIIKIMDRDLAVINLGLKKKN